jgi:hypothetical protein
MQKDDLFDTGNGSGVMGASMSWDDKHRPGCYINQWRGGLILNVTKRLATEVGTRKPIFWKDGQGNPDMTRPQKKNVLITVLAENERDPQDPTDAGIRTMWLIQKGRNRLVNGQWVTDDNDFAAFCSAMEEAGVPETLPEVGGYYYQMQTGTAAGKGTIDRKTWKANYQRPTPESLALFEQVTRQSVTPAQDSIFEGNGQPQQAPSAPPAPPQQPAPQYTQPAPQAPPRWSGNGQPQQPVPPASQPAYAQQQYAQAPPPNYAQHAGNQAPPQQPPAPPAPPQQYAGAPY